MAQPERDGSGQDHAQVPGHVEKEVNLPDAGAEPVEDSGNGNIEYGTYESDDTPADAEDLEENGHERSLEFETKTSDSDYDSD